VPFNRPKKEVMVVCPESQVPGLTCLVRYAPAQDGRFIDGGSRRAGGRERGIIERAVSVLQ
jgi:hypothetical protein